jgi:hypothetical protein
MNARLPCHVETEVQRILDAAARRVLSEALDRDALGLHGPAVRSHTPCGRATRGAAMRSAAQLPTEIMVGLREGPAPRRQGPAAPIGTALRAGLDPTQ